LDAGDYEPCSGLGFLAIQQQSLHKARSISSAPMMVKAIFPQETFHQAKTITRAARINLQKQKLILPPYLLVTANNTESFFWMSRKTMRCLKKFFQMSEKCEDCIFS
jgi:hypothetical protein